LIGQPNEENPACGVLAVRSDLTPRRSLITYLFRPDVLAASPGEAALLRVLNNSAAQLAAVTFGERDEPISWLSPREQEVLDRLVLGMSVREISEELHRSPHTIHDHVKNLHKKLNASSRGELIARVLGISAKPATFDTSPSTDTGALSGAEPKPLNPARTNPLT
jgi:DNA-binding CsgD family transcriptional regulator